MNVSIAIDNNMAELWKALAPKFNILQLDKPNKISDNIGISKPNIATHSLWISS